MIHSLPAYQGLNLSGFQWPSLKIDFDITEKLSNVVKNIANTIAPSTPTAPGLTSNFQATAAAPPAQAPAAQQATNLSATQQNPQAGMMHDDSTFTDGDNNISRLTPHVNKDPIPFNIKKYIEEHRDFKYDGYIDKRPEKTAPPETHVVQSGDNLWNISKDSLKAHGVSDPDNAQILAHRHAIIDANREQFEIAPGAAVDAEKAWIIQPGMELKLPTTDGNDDMSVQNNKDAARIDNYADNIGYNYETGGVDPEMVENTKTRIFKDSTLDAADQYHKIDEQGQIIRVMPQEGMEFDATDYLKNTPVALGAKLDPDTQARMGALLEGSGSPADGVAKRIKPEDGPSYYIWQKPNMDGGFETAIVRRTRDLPDELRDSFKEAKSNTDIDLRHRKTSLEDIPMDAQQVKHMIDTNMSRKEIRASANDQAAITPSENSQIAATFSEASAGKLQTPGVVADPNAPDPAANQGIYKNMQLSA